jgi:hypothetical protein
MKGLILTGVLVLVAALAGYFLLRQDASPSAPQEGSTKSLEYYPTVMAPSQNKAIAVDLEKSDKSALSPIHSNPPKNPLFRQVKIEQIRGLVTPKQGVEPLGAFIYATGALSALAVGDEIMLPDLEEASYTATVSSRIVNPDQSVTLKATLEGESQRYYAMMTEGVNTAYLTITTPNGIYEVEIIDDKGYVYSQSAMKRAWIDPTRTDAVLVPTPRPANHP